MAKEEGHARILGIDDLIRLLGNPGRLQTLTFVLLTLNYFPVVFHHVSMAFYGYTPPFHCSPSRPSHPHPHPAVTSYAANGNVTTNNNNNVTAISAGDDFVRFRSCDAMVTSGRTGANLSQVCVPGEFVYDLPPAENTVVTEWDLVCERAYLTHLATTVYYCGVMVGCFVCGYLSDRLGRRPVVLGTLWGVAIVGAGLAFVNHFPVFVALRFLLGFLTQGLHTASYILAIELFPVRHRTMAGCLIQLGWGAAVLALGGVAWLLRDWRHIQLALSLPSVLTIAYFWLLPESLRWLLAKDRWGQAERLVRRTAAFNRGPQWLKTHPERATQAVINCRRLPCPATVLTASKTSVHDKAAEAGEGEKPRGRQASVKDLFSTPVLLRRSLILFYIWFAGNVAYFGLTFMSTSLAGNRFVNYTLSATVEFLAYVLNIFLFQRFGRRNPLCVYFCIAAVSCLCVGLIPPRTASGTDLTKLITAFSVAGKFAAGGSFSFFELLTVEMYPTVLRNIGAGMCGFWGRLGAVLAPQCLSLGVYTFSQLPSIVIGCLTLAGAALTFLLPDTSKSYLPDTIQEITVLAATPQADDPNHDPRTDLKVKVDPDSKLPSVELRVTSSLLVPGQDVSEV